MKEVRFYWTRDKAYGAYMCRRFVTSSTGRINLSFIPLKKLIK
jgi:hypothetical protein